MSEPVRVVDTRGQPCPMPVIELAKAVDLLDVGEVVELVSDDATSKVDIPVWCRMRRQTLLSTEEHDGVWHFLVQRM